jgi:hypothetical protein
MLQRVTCWEVVSISGGFFPPSSGLKNTEVAVWSQRLGPLNQTNNQQTNQLTNRKTNQPTNHQTTNNQSNNQPTHKQIN